MVHAASSAAEHLALVGTFFDCRPSMRGQKEMEKEEATKRHPGGPEARLTYKLQSTMYMQHIPIDARSKAAAAYRAER